MARAAYVSYDSPHSWRVGGVKDPSHQHGLDGVPHDPRGGVGLQFLHQLVAERSCREEVVCLDTLLEENNAKGGTGLWLVQTGHIWCGGDWMYFISCAGAVLGTSPVEIWFVCLFPLHFIQLFGALGSYFAN